MSDQDYVLASGARLHVSTAKFEDANALRKALLKTAKGIALGDNPMKADVSVFKDVFIEAASSEDVERCLFKVLERASYEDVRITKELFDDPKLGDKARGDLFEIYWKAIQVNCAPFFEKAFSTLKAKMSNVAVGPRSA